MTATPPPIARNGKAAPHAIPLPSRAAVEERSRLRAAADNTAYQRQCDRVASLLKNADDAGHTRGHRAGYLQGVRWGMLCGGVLGASCMAVVWGASAPLHAVLFAL